MIKKLCSGCGKVIEIRLRLCPECQARMTSKRNKAYNAVLRDKDNDAVYNDLRWRKIKPVVHVRDRGKCRLCFDNHILNDLQMVHHIVELEHNMSLAYEPDNLISLCEACHQHVHAIYKTSGKVELQDKLRAMTKQAMTI